MELALMSFTNQIDALATMASCQQRRSNLMPQQYCLIWILQMDRQYKVCLTDKNLGPAILECDTYIKRPLQDHLAQANTYQPLSAMEANNMLDDTASKLKALVEIHRNQLPLAECTTLIDLIFLHTMEVFTILSV